MKALIAGLVGLMLVNGVVSAAEMGRQVIGADKAAAPTSSGPVVVKNYTGLSEGEGGLEFGVDWVSASWDVGDNSYSDATWSPSVALSYGVTDFLDIRIDARVMHLEDDAKDDKVDPTLDVIRVGVGARGWLNLSGDLYGYGGLLLGYYGFDGDDLDSTEGTIGGAIDAGVAYLINERAYIRGGLQYDQTLADASGKSKTGEDVDLSVSAVGFGVGVGMRF